MLIYFAKKVSSSRSGRGKKTLLLILSSFFCLQCLHSSSTKLLAYILFLHPSVHTHTYIYTLSFSIEVVLENLYTYYNFSSLFYLTNFDTLLLSSIYPYPRMHYASLDLISLNIGAWCMH